ncbi:dihydroneopterin aldolase [Campylobacter sp. LR286c]|uniref:dihydroneopterin aldolase n=1 Tax=Campylobacter sp. LR286c TaxID=2593545 RepID=UPI001237DF26|nr:dihydroneopterin aldolase [Campylobacter sp. LR286c]KAA6228502.1 FolB domain-containing protein [Campylobacter sp. LR286c]
MQSDIRIRLKFKCIIGMLDFERKKKQKIIVKISAKSNTFLDYTKLAKEIKKIYKKEKFYTIEESLKFISENLKNNFNELSYLKIITYKPQILKNTRVGAKIKKFF